MATTPTAELGLWRDTKGSWWGVDPHTKKFFTLCTKDKEVATTRYNRMLDEFNSWRDEAAVQERNERNE